MKIETEVVDAIPPDDRPEAELEGEVNKPKKRKIRGKRKGCAAPANIEAAAKQASQYRIIMEESLYNYPADRVSKAIGYRATRIPDKVNEIKFETKLSLLSCARVR